MLAKDTLTILNKSSNELETYNVHTGELISTSSGLVGSNRIVFDLGIAETICTLIREGNTLDRISKMEGMPSYHVMMAWRNHHPDFAKAMEISRRDRATVYHDRAVDVLERDDYLDKESLNNAKFKFDSYMKLAEKGNPDRYAAKPTTVVAGGGQSAPTIIVNTGISRIPQHVEGETYAQETAEDTDTGREVHTLRAEDIDIEFDWGVTRESGNGGDSKQVAGGVSEGFADSSSFEQTNDEEGDPQW